ncbi:alpha/beta hydrolase [Pedobacter sp. L105]|uniref:alpha/beta hydrolase n=1 Tax=Pedobacter sp. L105 TaxID=1641871 RepID=UPI00131CB26B|nr:alpha/beta hydrolase [Pedobacter sp. L105]
MKKAILYSMSAAALLVASSCSHKVQLTPGQETSISPEAVAFLKKTTYYTIPSWFPISDKQIIEGRNKFEAGEMIQEAKMIKQFNLKIDSTKIAGVPVLIVTPPVINPIYKDVIAFNIHGGGFTLGTARDRSALLVAAKLGMKVYSIDYSVAPEAKYPVAINQSLAVYKELIKQFDPKKMLGVSSSAGGEMILSMIQRINQEHLPMMKAQICFTPAADISGNGDSPVANDTRDVVTRDLAIRSAKDFYLGGADAKDPLVSPIYAAIPANFPATVFTTGTRDLLESNSIRMYWKLQNAGIESELLVQEGMWHGFHWEWNMPESIATMKAVSKFVEKQFTEKQ